MKAISTLSAQKAPASLTLLKAAAAATSRRRSKLASARPSRQSQPNEAGHRVDVGSSLSRAGKRLLLWQPCLLKAVVT